MSSVKGRNGGARIGAGRPKVVGSARWQREQKRLLRHGGKPPRVPVVKRKPVKAPADMPAEQRAVWASLAPHAVAAGTLTAATAAAFADLCEAIVLKRLMLAQIMADGLTSSRVTLQMAEDGGGLQNVEPKAHCLLSRFQAQMVRVEAGMLRFMLTGMGKPAAKPEVPVDEWAEFDGPQLVKGAAK